MLLASLAPLLIFVAFLLLLLVSLSAPIINSIYLFRLVANISASLLDSGASGSARFGVWGYCLSSIDVSVLGIDHNSAAQCSKAKLGYNFDSNVATALHVNGLQNVISRTLTAALVLNPIACSLTFLALLSSLFILRRHGAGVSRLASLFTLGIGLVAALLTTIVFLIDVIFVAIVRHRIKNATDGDLIFDWGNAVWMTLGATIALWGALVGACCGLVGLRRSNKARDSMNRY
ncbi:actin cortical patch SUR7/pH-response regulator pali [Abortiporus biennis]|nr:actin cortical patch SUR7/pH-response regulator pali [Abortiporus biennis]